MCGRYFISADDIHIQEILNDLRRNGEYDRQLKSGEIYPSDFAPIIDKNAPLAAQWGFPSFKGKGIIINARAESVEDKRTFKDSVLNRRCVIPCSAFYEWDKRKQKYSFELPDKSPFYLGGFYKVFDGVRRFTVMTTAANESVIDVHERMPILIPDNIKSEWLGNTTLALDYIHSELPLVIKKLDN